MAETPSVWRRAAPWVAASLFYVAFAILQTWPLVDHLSEVMPSDLGDPVLNTWVVWWNSHAVPFTARWWNAPAFWPSTGALAFSEVLLGLSPITTPIQLLGGGPMAAYNVAFVLTFPLSALAAHALAYRLTGRHDAAFLAGLIYGFNPFRVGHFPQIQVMTSYWMPLALLGLHEYVSRREKRWLVLFGGAWLMQAFSNGYYLLFFPVLLGFWIVWFVPSRGAIRTLGPIVSTWVIASLPLIPMLWTYRRIHSVFNFQRHLGEVSGFSADVMSLLDASPLLKFWTLRSFHKPEGELFPGFTAAALVLLLALHWLRSATLLTRVPRPALVVLAGSVVYFSVGVSAVLFGVWPITIGEMTLMSVQVVNESLSIGGMLFVLGLMLVPPVSGPWLRRSPVMFYALAMGLMYLLCFGPQPRFRGVPFMYRGPYALLMALPGYDSIRVPARFAMLAALCLSVAAAFAFARLTSRTSRGPRMLLATAAICGVLVDSAIGEMPLKTLPLRFHSLESLPGGAAVVELPFGNLFDDAQAMYRGMFHGRPVVNGYSGFTPPGYDFLRRGFAIRDPEVFDALTAFGPVVVVVDVARDPQETWARQLAERPGVTVLPEESGHKMFLLPGGTLPREVNTSDRLPVWYAVASVNGDRLPLAFDGKVDTRWNSGPQNGNEAITLDLGSTRFVDGLILMIGPHMLDYPRILVIESSDDRLEWTTRWQGSSAAAMFAAVVRHPKQTPLTFGLPHFQARWLRLRQLGHDPVNYWSIVELSVFGR